MWFPSGVENLPALIADVTPADEARADAAHHLIDVIFDSGEPIKPSIPVWNRGP